MLTPEQRIARARMAARYLHSRYLPQEITAPARRAFLARFERQVDPEGLLSSDERERRAKSALRAHMLRLALASSRARSSLARRKASRQRTTVTRS